MPSYKKTIVSILPCIIHWAMGTRCFRESERNPQTYLCSFTKHKGNSNILKLHTK